MINKNLFATLSTILFLSGSLFAQEVDLPVIEFEKGIALQNIQILDVRTKAEYKSGHLRNAFHADWLQPQTFESRIQSLDKNKPVYTYCLSGGRSGAAAKRLREAGFTQVYNMQGGIKAWKEANKEVEGVALVKAISMEEYLAKIPADKTVLVDIGAVWCPPCKKMEPVLKELQSDKLLNFTLINIDGGVQEKLAVDLNATEFPTFIIYKNGKELWRQSGIVAKEELMKQLK